MRLTIRTPPMRNCNQGDHQGQGRVFAARAQLRGAAAGGGSVHSCSAWGHFHSEGGVEFGRRAAAARQAAGLPVCKYRQAAWTHARQPGVLRQEHQCKKRGGSPAHRSANVHSRPLRRQCTSNGVQHPMACSTCTALGDKTDSC